MENTITIITQALVTLQADGTYVPYQVGDDINFVYVQLDLSDGTTTYITGSWPVDVIQGEIDSTVAIHNTNAQVQIQQTTALQTLVGD
jgi:hypothetical protein